MSAFQLDERLGRDSALLVRLGLCQLRLMNDRRWPWLILVPERADISELYELPMLDQQALTIEVNMVAAALKKATGAEKINVGALGNIVRQLHIHVVARRSGDANWPGPIWGFGMAEPYNDHDSDTLTATLLEALSA